MQGRVATDIERSDRRALQAEAPLRMTNIFLVQRSFGAALVSPLLNSASFCFQSAALSD